MVEQQYIVGYEREVVGELIILYKNTGIRCEGFRIVSITENTFFPNCSTNVLGVMHNSNRWCLVAEVGVKSATCDGQFPFEMLPCDMRS